MVDDELVQELLDIYDDYCSSTTLREKHSAEPEFHRVGRELLEAAGLVNADYKEQILWLFEQAETSFTAHLVAGAVGCSSQHVQRFTYDDEQGAGMKDYAKAAQDEKVSPGTRKRIISRDGGCCKRCGSTTSLEVHHILPVGRGGKNNDSNLVTLCGSCHRAAHDGDKTVTKTAYDPSRFSEWLQAGNGPGAMTQSSLEDF